MSTQKTILIVVIVSITYFLLRSLDQGQNISTSNYFRHPVVDYISQGFKSSLEESTQNESPEVCDRTEEILYVEQHFKEMEQDDPRLIRYVRNRYMTPIPRGKPLQLKHPDFQRTTLGAWIKRFYKGKREGIFIEAGANTGESTNTLELEIEHGWSGVLIECNPKITPALRSTNRKAWIAQVCLSNTQYPQMINLSVPETWDYSARIGPAWDLSKFGVQSNWTNFENVEGVTLFTVLASVGITEVDYFSFDIEGAEFDVLKTFLFNRILIKVLITEVYFLSPQERLQLQAFLKKNGLVFIRDIEMDQIYVHESLLDASTNMTVAALAQL